MCHVLNREQTCLALFREAEHVWHNGMHSLLKERALSTEGQTLLDGSEKCRFFEGTVSQGAALGQQTQAILSSILQQRYA